MSEDSQRRQALADFLRNRRSRLSPFEVGLAGSTRRRTPGLRREEVATLAHVGISWYTALEQGREVRPSESVLTSLAEVLRLNIAERHHLFWLARQLHEPRPLPIQETLDEAFRQILADLDPTPAYILGRRWDYLGWNTMADLVFNINSIPLQTTPNFIWQLFTDPAKRTFYPNWARVRRNVVASFRTETQAYAGQDWFVDFVNDLQAVSSDFREVWQAYEVTDVVSYRKEMIHAELGNLYFDHTTLQFSAQPALKLIIYTPVGETTAKLKELYNRNSAITRTDE